MKKIIFLLFFIFLTLLTYSLVETHSINITYHSIFHSKVPKGFKGYKIIFFSDIHYDHFFYRHKLEKMIDLIQAENPDLILMGGDYVDRSKKIMVPLFKKLKRLRNATTNVYGVSGNHDHWAGYAELKKSFIKAKIELLDNRNITITRTRKLEKAPFFDILVFKQQRY